MVISCGPVGQVQLVDACFLFFVQHKFESDTCSLQPLELYIL